MIKQAAAVFCLTILASQAAAQEEAFDIAEGFAARCVTETGARGTFELNYEGLIPQVVGGEGTSQSNVRKVNDCMADKYEIQPGLTRTAAAVPTVQRVRNQIFRRQPARFVLGGCGRGGLMVRGTGYCNG